MEPLRHVQEAAVVHRGLERQEQLVMEVVQVPGMAAQLRMAQRIQGAVAADQQVMVQ